MVYMGSPAFSAGNRYPRTSVTPEEVRNDYHPNVVFVDENNKIARVTTYEKHGLLKDMT